MNKVLIIENAQYDFMPGGSLEIKDGDKIIPKINSLLPKFDLVIFTKDWHPKNHISFASQWPNNKPFDDLVLHHSKQTLWPDHCVQNTRGSDIHDDINYGALKKDFYIFKKGVQQRTDSYSGFYDKKVIITKSKSSNKLLISTGLTEFLKNRNIEQVFIAGLTLDFCYTAIDSVKCGFDTYVFEDAIKPINSDFIQILKDFKTNNIKLIETFEFEQLN